MGKMKTGLIGCGVISEVYLRNAIERFSNIEMVAVANRSPEAARKRAQQFNLRACSVDELLADPDIQIVMNLTPPDQHFPVSIEILRAGKHVYSEKPLAVTFDEGRELLAYAKSHDLHVGCAPDTFLGGGLQTCRRLIDEGAIGEPFAGLAFMLSCGPEHFHPNPEFFYQPGAGPILDWGPYYVSALIALLGPVKSVGSVGKIVFSERTVEAKDSPRYGQTFKVEVPTTVTSILEFAQGAAVNLTMSFDLPFLHHQANLPYIRLYGKQGNLTLPDVNTFGGPVYLREGAEEPRRIDLINCLTDNSRGMGLADMIHSIETGTSYCASGEFALHTLEVMLKILESAERRQFLDLETTCERPDPLPEKTPDYLYA